MIPLSPKSLHTAPHRVVWLLAAFTIALLAVTSIGIAIYSRQTVLTDAEAHLRARALMFAKEENRSFQAIDLVQSNVVNALGLSGVRDQGAFDRLAASEATNLLLRDNARSLRMLHSVSIVNRDGKLLNSSRFWPTPEVDVADRDYFQALTEDGGARQYISEPLTGQVEKIARIYVARRIENGSGGLLGILLTSVSLNYFEDFYRSVTPDKGSAVSLIRLDGTLLARHPHTDAIGHSFDTGQRALGGGTVGTVTERSPIDGALRIKVALTLPDFPMLILATITEEAALRDWRKLCIVLAVGTFGLALAVAVVAFVLSRQWTQRESLRSIRAELARQQERTATYEALEVAKDEAEAASRAKSEFLAQMSHELRTPLNAILGFAALMSQEIRGPLGNDDYKVYLEDIEQSGRHLLGIINDILDLAKAEAGQLTADKWPVDIREIVAGVESVTREQARAGGLEFIVEVAAGDFRVSADSRKIRQILLNLLSNAFKFSKHGGRVVVTVAEVCGAIVLTVADNGIGIPAADIERILQPFEQVDRSLSRSYDGAGLGLPLVKIMAEMHGGSFRIESGEGAGTRAIVTLPRLACDDRAGPAAKAAA